MDDTGDLQLSNGLAHSYSNGAINEDFELDPYANDAKHSKYWRSLQTAKPFRFPK